MNKNLTEMNATEIEINDVVELFLTDSFISSG